MFHAANLIRYAFLNVPINITHPMYQIPLIRPKFVQWELEQGYKYMHLGLIQFGVNPLVRTSLNLAFLVCVIDSP